MKFAITLFDGGIRGMAQIVSGMLPTNLEWSLSVSSLCNPSMDKRGTLTRQAMSRGYIFLDD